MRSIAIALMTIFIAGCASKPPVSNVIPPPKAMTLARPLMLVQGGTISVPVHWQLYTAPANRLNIWMGKSTSSFSLAAAVLPSSTSTMIGGLKKNQWYYFKMTAVSTNGLESGPSTIVSYNSKQ